MFIPTSPFIKKFSRYWADCALPKARTELVVKKFPFQSHIQTLLYFKDDDNSLLINNSWLEAEQHHVHPSLYLSVAWDPSPDLCLRTAGPPESESMKGVIPLHPRSSGPKLNLPPSQSPNLPYFNRGWVWRQCALLLSLRLLYKQRCH